MKAIYLDYAAATPRQNSTFGQSRQADAEHAACYYRFTVGSSSPHKMHFVGTLRGPQNKDLQ